jgi:ribosomal protein S18 acetylase RimI-like enzyme
VFVDEKHRGHGIARDLLAEVLQRATSLAGLDQIILTVGNHQAAAKRLYSSLGFTIFGHEHGALKMNDGSRDEYVDEDYMVFVLPSPPGCRI